MEKGKAVDKVRVLVTGNEGYVGSVLTEKLINDGYDVFGLDNGLFRDVAFVPRVGGLSGQVYKDIRDVDEHDLDGVDVVMHLAGLSNDPLGEFDSSLTMEINHKASVRLAEIAKSVGVKRLLFSSTCSTYGKSDDLLVNEDSKLDPRTAYAESKVAVESDVGSMKGEGFEVVMLRNATVFGISPRLRVDLVVQNLAATGFHDSVIRVLSDGTPWRPLVHVRDVASAFSFFAKAPADKVSGQSFNIGHDDNTVQIKDLASMVAGIMPGCGVSIGQEHSPDERSYRVDFSKASGLGWSAKVSLEDGVKEVLRSYALNSFSKDDFESDKYNTLLRYQNLIKSGVIDGKFRVRKTQEA